MCRLYEGRNASLVSLRERTKVLKEIEMDNKEEKEILEEEKMTEEVETQQETDEVSREEELEAKVASLEAEIKKFHEDDVRRAADTENYKKRLLKDKENAVRFANENLVKDLLDPLDNFSRALMSAEQNKDFDGLKSGISMVEDQLLAILKNNWGLEVIETKDKPFDPQVMEAYSMQEKDGLEEETVLMEFQRGYMLHGKVLRSSKVMVGKPKA